MLRILHHGAVYPKPRRVIPGLALVFLAMVLATIAAQAKQAEPRAGTRPPNVLFVLADQWRAAAFGYAGNPDVKTPNLDRLQREGVSFVNAVSGHAGLLARRAPRC